MRQGFTMRQWMDEVKRRKPEIDILVDSLQSYGGSAEFDEESHDMAALHYATVFLFEDGVIVNIGLVFFGSSNQIGFGYRNYDCFS